MAKTDPVDPNVPAGSEDPKLGDNRIRTLAAAVAELLNVNHYMGADGGAGTGYNEDAAGEHTVVTLRVEASDPAAEADKIKVYGKDVNSKTEAHLRDEDGNVIQLTSAGAIKKSVLQDSAFVPPGVLAPYAAASAPTGWLLCDGTAVSRTTYADLFGIISTTYGVGNGSTTFNIPDMRGRVPVGLDVGNANMAAADTLGETGGEENHVLSVNQLATHSHLLNVEHVSSGSNRDYPVAAGDGALDSTSSAAITNEGDNEAHNNVQPYNTVNYIIKT